MTARPRRRRGAEAPASGEFPEVEIPAHVLGRCRGLSAIERADVVEGYLREQHGEEPNVREDRRRYEAYLDATEGRAFELLGSGALAD